MCIVCVEWSKGKMTEREAKRAVREFVTEGHPHIESVDKMVDNLKPEQVAEIISKEYIDRAAKVIDLLVKESKDKV